MINEPIKIRHSVNNLNIYNVTFDALELLSHALTIHHFPLI